MGTLSQLQKSLRSDSKLCSATAYVHASGQGEGDAHALQVMQTCTPLLLQSNEPHEVRVVLDGLCQVDLSTGLKKWCLSYYQDNKSEIESALKSSDSAVRLAAVDLVFRAGDWAGLQKIADSVVGFQPDQDSCRGTLYVLDDPKSSACQAWWYWEATFLRK